MTSVKPPTISEIVGKRVAEVRRRQEWTAEQLAEKCREAGAENFTAAMVNNIETRRGRSVTVDELLVLALVLNVAPVNLLVPPRLGSEDLYNVTPTRGLRAGRVRQWLRGVFPWPNSDRHIFLTETAVDEWAPPPGSYNPVGIDRAEYLSDLRSGGGDDGQR